MNLLAWLLPLALPVVLAGVAALVAPRRRPALLVLAPVPALLLALAGPPGPPPDLSWILLGVQLHLDGVGRVLLALTAGVWLAAGASAGAVARRSTGTSVLWLVTLAGNLGVVVAADVVTFTTAYTVLSFAAYGLVVHDRSPGALRAGRVMIALAVVGEVLLLAGMLLATAPAGSLLLADIAAAPPLPAMVLLAAGFAVKAGIVPLHVWLPLAHPAAPVPASAVLSGAMIKAGAIGWLRLLPLGADPGGAELSGGLGPALIGIGLATAVLGAAVGLTQTRAKVVLAYSSVSQMGLLTVAVGVGLAAPAAAPAAVAATATYALHHGLAKAALFLGVGVLATATGRARQLVLAGMVLAALALTGAPLTSGAAAKGVLKTAVAGLDGSAAGRLSLALGLAAVGTTLLMLRLAVVVRRTLRPPGGDAAATAAAGPWAGAGARVAYAAVLLAVLTATWVLPAAWLEVAPGPPTLGGWWDATWPLLLGGVVGGAVLLLHRSREPAAAAADRPPRVPPGDLVVVFEAVLAPSGRLLARTQAPVAQLRRLVQAIGALVLHTLQPGQGFTRLDERLTRWRVAGGALVLLLVALAVALGASGG